MQLLYKTLFKNRGEAIAFGEAISVPMRMRFNRVATQHLPKANGIAPPIADDTPDTVDLRSIVSRMRAAAGPDISNFRQSYDADLPGFSDDADDAELDSWNRELKADETPSHFEPYRPDMLPRGSAFAAKAPAPAPRTDLGRTAFQADAARSVFSEESKPSLRETLLKKPLGSLYRKD